MKTDKRLPLEGPVFAHDCDECIYLGHYEEHDLYFCPKELGGEGTVIARYGGDGPEYASGLPFGQQPLGYYTGTHSRHLRIAYLIAADLGFVPFSWGGILSWPEQCKPPVAEEDGVTDDAEKPKGQPCQRCGEYCVAYCQAKCSDLFYMQWPGGREQEGYVPPDDICGVRADGSEDYMSVYLCLACGQVQGKWPKKSVKKWLERGSRPVAEDKPKKKRKKAKEQDNHDQGVCRICGKGPAHPEDDMLCVRCLDNKATCENWTD